MRLLYCGDVVGKAGRKVLKEHLPDLQNRLKLDFVLVNGENAAHGFGVTSKIYKEFTDLGVGAVTTGNHAWDQKEMLVEIDGLPRMIRPHNYPAGTPGHGAKVFTVASGRKVLVVQVMGRLFMDPLDDPFACLDKELSRYKLGACCRCDYGRCPCRGDEREDGYRSFPGWPRFFGCRNAHSHSQCGCSNFAERYGLPDGCGDVRRLQLGYRDEKRRRHRPLYPQSTGARLEPQDGPATLCAVYVETDDRTGLAARIEPVRLGGRLIENCPELL